MYDALPRDQNVYSKDSKSVPIWLKHGDEWREVVAQVGCYICERVTMSTQFLQLRPLTTKSSKTISGKTGTIVVHEAAAQDPQHPGGIIEFARMG